MALLVALVVDLISIVPIVFVLTYAMHSLLVVVQETAAGNDEVQWPAEPFQDSFGGAFHLVAVVLIALAPIGILSHALNDVLLPGDPMLRFLLLAIPGLWLFLPVVLLSSLSASSGWFVFRPVVAWNMLRLAPSTSIVYVLSALLAELITALAYATLICGWLVVAPVAAAATAAALLIYGRLLGRLGWKMSRLYVSKQKRLKKKARLQAQATSVRQAPTRPSEPPSPEEVDAEWETTPYGQKRRRTEGYVITQDSPTTADAPSEDGITSLDGPTPEAVTDQLPQLKATDFDRRVRANTSRVVASKRSFLGGVFTFPWYRETRLPWLLLSMGFTVVYGAAYVMVSLYLALYKGG